MIHNKKYNFYDVMCKGVATGGPGDIPSSSSEMLDCNRSEIDFSLNR